MGTSRELPIYVPFSLWMKTAPAEIPRGTLPRSFMIRLCGWAETWRDTYAWNYREVGAELSPGGRMANPPRRSKVINLPHSLQTEILGAPSRFLDEDGCLGSIMIELSHIV